MACVLVLGRGKTGSIVAQMAAERGHSVRVVGTDENAGGRALTSALLAQIDVAIDFTTPDAVIGNLHALLGQRARVVVGTTGWYASLNQMGSLAVQHGSSLVHGTNFSLGVQAFFRAARELSSSLPGYEIAIDETHHVTKKDAPSGTALTLQQVVEEASGQEARITSHREGNAAGLHVLTLRSPEETITLRHEAYSRKGFALGAVRAAEWLMGQPPGVWNFADVAPLL